MPLTAEVAPKHAPATGDRAAVEQWWQRPLLLITTVELVVLFAPTAAWLVDRWTISVWQNAHGMFVPPLAAWLAWHELKRLPTLPVKGSRWGFAFVVPALAIHAIDAGLHTQLLSAVALLLSIPGLSLLLLGTAPTRAIAFPLLFLVFAIPIPLAFTEPVHLLLRQVAANATAALLPTFGISVFLEGTMLHTVGSRVEVSDACSGFSTLYAAIAVACLAAYTAQSRRRRALVLLAAAPIAIAANILRVIALTLAVVWSGGWILETFLHPLSGMLTFALALPVLFWLGGSPKKGARP